MRTVARVLAFSACVMLIGAPPAFADEVSDELAEMRALVEQLQGQVEAQSEQIEHQGDVIREARLEQAKRSDERYGASGITAFLQRLEVEGWVAGSYFWNFNNPNNPALAAGVGANTGVSGNVYPFHGNHNNFQVDQVWFGIEHPIDAENRAGFRFDLVYGATACTLGNSPGFRCAGSDFTSEYYVNQAYVQYLAPFTSNGITIKAGKFGTLIGAEVAQTTANFNITRGNVYNILQPIDHVGVIASTEFGESGFSTAFGVVNDGGNGFFSGADPDWNDAKSITAQVGWAGEEISAAATLLWGPPAFQDNDHASGIFDLVVTWDPTEDISAWINFDYAWAKVQGPNQHAWGLATAARYAVTERLGIAGRFEYVRDDDGFAGWLNPNAPGVRNADIYSLTGTVDYALTSNLMVRGEVRYDNITKDNSNDNEFFDHGGDLRPSQTTAGVEIVYEF